MPWYLTVLITIAIIIVSGFCVIIEFALLAARRHRLEEDAPTSKAARGAIRAQNELTMMLAAAQLGITACTFALGAITKPAVHRWLMPPLEALGIPVVVADVVSFILALFVVTFLHLVIGEMAPKSWAIAHPETASKAIALPANGLVAVLRPLLKWINHVANRLVARTGVEPVDRAAAGGYDADTLRTLIEHSTETGALDQEAADQIASLIQFESRTVGEVVGARRRPATAVDHDATVADVQAAARESGHFRILLRPAPDVAPGSKLKVVHVRDTLLSEPDTPAASLAREALHLEESSTLQGALERMRLASKQLAVVVPDSGKPRILGVLTAADFLDQIWPTIEVNLAAN